jgi:hypothetical protein
MLPRIADRRLCVTHASDVHLEATIDRRVREDRAQRLAIDVRLRSRERSAEPSRATGRPHAVLYTDPDRSTRRRRLERHHSGGGQPNIFGGANPLNSASYRHEPRTSRRGTRQRCHPHTYSRSPLSP